MVVGEAVDRALGAVGKGDQTGRREHARLAHAATDHLAGAPGTRHELARSDDDRSHRATEGLRETESNRIGRRGEVLSGHAVVPQATTAFQVRAPSM